MNIIEKVLKYLFIAGFFILVLTFLIFPITDLDIWMHLVNGKYILENFKIPQSEFYSYTAFGKPWVDHEWLAQIVFYTFYKFGSYNGLIILRIIIFLFIFSAFFIILSKKTNYFLAILSSLLALFISHERFFLRPEVFTLLFAVAYLFILEEYRLRGGKFIYLLPILQIFWVNLHGYFLLGIIIPLLFLIGQFFEKKNNLSDLFLLLILITAACFINPYAYQGAVYPFKVLVSSLNPEWRSVLKEISELKSPFLAGGPALFWFKFLLITSLGSFFISLYFKSLKISRILIYLLFLILGITVKRHEALFALAVILITVYNLKEIFLNANIRQFNADKRRFFSKNIGDNWRRIILFLGIIYFAVFTQQIAANQFYLKNHILKTFNLGLTPEIFPERAVDFLLKEDFKGNIFNDMIGGSYLVWRYYPKRKVFLDGRTEVYGPGIFKGYLSIFRKPEAFLEIALKYDINYILLNHSLGGRNKLIKYLLENPKWALVYFDQTAVVFIKNSKENKNIIDKFSLNLNDFGNPGHPFWANISKDYKKDYKFKKYLKGELFPYGFLKAGYLFLDLKYPQTAEISFSKALELNPNLALAYLGLANAYNQRKLYPEALAFYGQALSKDSRLSEAYYNLARLYEEEGLVAQAEKCYQRSLRLDPYSARGYYDLGFLYFNQKKFSLAAKQFKKAIKLNPSFGEACRALGAVLANKGEMAEAEKFFKKAIALVPNDEELDYNLGLVLESQGKFNSAVAQFQKVLRLNPKNLVARHHLAISYLSLNSLLKAQEQWLIIKKEDPNNALAKEYLKKLERLGYEDAFN